MSIDQDREKKTPTQHYSEVLDGDGKKIGSDHLYGFKKVHKALHFGLDNCDRLTLAPCFLRWVEVILKERGSQKDFALKIIHMFHQLPLHNLNSKANLITKTKNLIKKAGKSEKQVDMLLMNLRLSKEEKHSRDRQLELARFQKADHCLSFDSTFIKNVMMRYSHSDLWQRRTIAIALATGLRQHEILKTARITKINGTHIWVSGLLKKRKEDGEYSRPVLFLSPSKVVDLLKEIQDIYTSELKPSTASSLLVKEVRKTFGPEWTFHRLRAAYCNLGFHEFATSESLPCWIHKVLNHSSNTMINALFYCNVKPNSGKKAS